MQTLDNKIAIVTGGAQGIGKSIALALDREGAKVIIADIEGASELIQKEKGIATIFSLIHRTDSPLSMTIPKESFCP